MLSLNIQDIGRAVDRDGKGYKAQITGTLTSNKAPSPKVLNTTDARKIIFDLQISIIVIVLLEYVSKLIHYNVHISVSIYNMLYY